MAEFVRESHSIGLMGASLDTDNRGVSALASSLVKMVNTFRPDIQIVFLSGRRSGVQEVMVSGHKVEVAMLSYRLSPKARLHENLFWILLIAALYRIIPLEPVRKRLIGQNPFLRAMLRAKFIGDIRGGDSFSDIYGLGKFLMGSLPDFIAFLLKKKLVLLPQTYGPYKSRMARLVARFILNNSSSIFARDTVSLERVHALVGKEKPLAKTKFCPDVAFTLDSVLPANPTIEPPLDKDRKYPLIGLNINGLMYNGGYSGENMFDLNIDYREFTYRLIEKLLEEVDVHVVLIPHTFAPSGNVNSDPDACRDALSRVSARYRNRIHLLTGEYDVHEIKGIIGLCDFFIGSRMHACIAALSQKVPTAALAYSPKFAGVFDSAGVPGSVIDCTRTSAAAATKTVIDNFRNRSSIKRSLEGSIAGLTSQINQTFLEMLT